MYTKLKLTLEKIEKMRHHHSWVWWSAVPHSFCLSLMRPPLTSFTGRKIIPISIHHPIFKCLELQTKTSTNNRQKKKKNGTEVFPTFLFPSSDLEPCNIAARRQAGGVENEWMQWFDSRMRWRIRVLDAISC